MRIEFRRIGCILIVTTATAFCVRVGLFSPSVFSAEETGGKTESTAKRTNAVVHPVIFKQHEGPRKISTGLTNLHGQPVMASCSSCHATTRPNVETRAAADLDQFHQGLKYLHGNLSRNYSVGAEATVWFRLVSNEKTINRDGSDRSPNSDGVH